MNKNKVCSRCEELRIPGENQDLDLALKCSPCKGTGIIRDTRSYICNGCGKSPCLHIHKESLGEPYGLIEETVSGAYASETLCDCTTYTFSLCEDCLRVLFDGFVVPPTIGSYMGGGFESYAEEKEYSLQRKWDRGTGPKENLLAGICNQFRNCKNPAAFRKFTGTGKYLTEDVTCFEHMDCGLYSGEMWAPIQDVPVDASKEQIVKAYLKAMEQPSQGPHSSRNQIVPKHVVYFNFSGDIFDDLIGVEDPEDKLSVVWFPNDMIPEPEYKEMFGDTYLHCYKLDTGTLCYYDREALEQRVKQNYRAKSTLNLS